MTIEQLRNLYNAQPFRPFVIHLADGRSVPVNHREFIMSVPSGRTVFVAQPHDTINIVNLPLVTDLELEPTPQDLTPRRSVPDPCRHGGSRSNCGVCSAVRAAALSRQAS